MNSAQSKTPPPRPRTAGPGPMSSPMSNNLMRRGLNPATLGGQQGSPVPGGGAYPQAGTPPPNSMMMLSQSAAPIQGTPGNRMMLANTSGTPSAAGGSDRLEGVKASLASLNQTLSGGNKSEKKQSALGEGRLLELKDASIRIEQHLALEVKRRAEADAKLQQLIDVRAKEMAQGLEKRVTDRMVQMHQAVDGLTKRVGQLNRELAVEREKNVRLTQELKYHAGQGLSDIRATVEQEKLQRMEKEQLLAKKLGEDVFRMQERLDVERHAREVMLTAVKEDMSKFSGTREKSDERFVRKLREDIIKLREQLQAEEETRAQGEEQLAQAMEDIVAQVHGSLKALSQA